jgi:hypothetical protein
MIKLTGQNGRKTLNFLSDPATFTGSSDNKRRHIKICVFIGSMYPFLRNWARVSDPHANVV